MSNPTLLSEQRSFLEQLRAQDSRISINFGRLESRKASSEAAKELLRYLARLKTPINAQVFHDLIKIGRAHAHTRVFIEKAVDVNIAVDMVTLAVDDAYDTAYLLSADGDFTPAVAAVRKRGKKVFAVSPGPGAKLAASVNSYIRLKRGWFVDCY